MIKKVLKSVMRNDLQNLEIASRKICLATGATCLLGILMEEQETDGKNSSGYFSLANERGRMRMTKGLVRGMRE